MPLSAAVAPTAPLAPAPNVPPLSLPLLLPVLFHRLNAQCWPADSAGHTGDRVRHRSSPDTAPDTRRSAVVTPLTDDDPSRACTNGSASAWLACLEAL